MGSCNSAGVRSLKEFICTLNTLKKSSADSRVGFLGFFWLAGAWMRTEAGRCTGVGQILKEQSSFAWLTHKYVVTWNSKSLRVFPSLCFQTFLILGLSLLRAYWAWSPVGIPLVSVIIGEKCFLWSPLSRFPSRFCQMVDVQSYVISCLVNIPVPKERSTLLWVAANPLSQCAPLTETILN